MCSRSVRRTAVGYGVETMNEVTVAQYIDMIRQKTAVLLGFSLELGGMLASASKADCKALREFGVNIGIGFQLMDDLLDLCRPEKVRQTSWWRYPCKQKHFY